MEASGYARWFAQVTTTFCPHVAFNRKFCFRSTYAVGASGAVRARPQRLGDKCFGKDRSIKPGMTRQDLLKVFKTEGGLSTRLPRTFVSRDCPYFKGVVEFKAATGPDRDNVGFLNSVEDNRDIIVRVSKPSSQFAIGD
jgi:hypothetical protein